MLFSFLGARIEARAREVQNVKTLCLRWKLLLRLDHMFGRRSLWYRRVLLFGSPSVRNRIFPVFSPSIRPRRGMSQRSIGVVGRVAFVFGRSVSIVLLSFALPKVRRKRFGGGNE